MSFLKAEWRKLAIANFIIEPEVLLKYIPSGTELDLYNGKCYVSLVGFMFLNTKLLGVKVPFHVDFEEVNLRFYVKRIENDTTKRGVVFIKEIVPKPALTLVANTVYNENYETLPMKHFWKEDAHNLTVSYQWKKNGKWNRFLIKADNRSSEIKTGSETEFITEHYWGYAKVDQEKTNEYEVRHPRWEKYNVSDYELEVDFGSVYGKEFEFLGNRKPDSVMLAEGSEITVENKTAIKQPNHAQKKKP